jgi:hypothetical protein
VFFFLVFRLIYRDWQRAAFVTAALTVLFFTYGHVTDLVQPKWNVSPVWLGVFWTALAILVFVLAGLRKLHFQGAALTLNIISLGLTLYAANQVISMIPSSVPSDYPSDPHAPIQTLDVPPGTTPPDIYYFILDSFARSDLLKLNLQYDDSAFISDLQDAGFYVAKCSQSNYPRTDVSLGSSLNMDYLQNLNENYSPENEDRTQLWKSIQDSTVRYELEQAGYKTVAFASGFAFTELTNADVYLSPSSIWGPLSEFEILLMRTTPLRHLEDLGWVNLEQIDGQRYRERTLLVLNSMEKLAKMPGPKFVFIHLVIPHPLFVFAPDGSPTDPSLFLNENGIYTRDRYYEGYRNQAAFISTRMEQAVNTLLTESSKPPVIVIQGDHGPWLQTGSDQFKILNAYYLPGHNDLLYPGISPVNTFRLIFDTYLGADYPLLQDISYASPIPFVFDLSPVPNPCTGK